MARFPRKPRTPRRPYAKTKYSVGWCKRPACTCWTPAGCIGPEMLEAVKAAGLLGGASADCYPGPCYDYGACVTNQCFSEVACAIRGIFQFWADKYAVVAAYVAARGADALAAVTAAGEPGALELGGAAPGGTLTAAGTYYTKGCPPGRRWVIGLTGCSCQPIEIPYPPATPADILAQCGVDVLA